MRATARCYMMPTPRQSEIIRGLETPDEALIVTTEDIFGRQVAPRTAIKQIMSGPLEGGLQVLCLNELAVYVLGMLDYPGDVGFDPQLLSAVTKTEMRSFLEHVGVPLITATPFTLGVDEPAQTTMPYVVKPDFGFASQLVMHVRGPDEWNDFCVAASDSSLWPLRYKYSKALFSDREGLLNRFLAERDCSTAQFLSVPFVFADDVAVAYVVDGTVTESSMVTHFAWRGFQAPTSLSDLDIGLIETELTAIARGASCRPGVYAAEILWTPEEHWILEFSPRPTGGLVPDLVSHAYGVDIDMLAVQLFRGDLSTAPQPQSGAIYVGQRIEGVEKSPYPNATLVHTSRRRSATTLLRDEIWRLSHGVS